MQAWSSTCAPIAGDALTAAGGFGLYQDNEWFGGTPKVFSGGISFRWRPTPDTEIIPFWSLDTIWSEEASPTYFTSGGVRSPRACAIVIATPGRIGQPIPVAAAILA